MASVASADAEGGQKQPPTDIAVVPPQVCAWLYATATEGGFARTTASMIVTEILDRVASCIITNSIYVQELCHALYMVAGQRGGGGLPTFAMMTRSPQPVDDVAALCANCHEKSERATSLVIYHLAIASIGKRMKFSRVRDSGIDAMESLMQVMVVYADECTFPLTSDWYLHVLLRMHLPSWGIQLESGGAYEAVANVMGIDANVIARKFLDAQPVDLIRGKDHSMDDVVLFVVVVTLMAEVSGEPGLQLAYNRDLAVEAFDIPRPFVLCDFPVKGLATDAYGFAWKDVMYAANGQGVGMAVMAWLSACETVGAATEITQFLRGNAPPSNTLNKYTAK